MCLYVCLSDSVRLLHAGIVSKRLIVESRKQSHTIAQGINFDGKDLGEIWTESLYQWGRQMQVGGFKIGDFWQITRYNSKMVPYTTDA